MFKTEKGTELPLLKLKGKDYLQVAHRILWFTEKYPEWSIETEFVELNNEQSIAKAIIKDESGRIRATAHKSETIKGFADHIEKSETGAIGRALALVGCGTQFTMDLHEGERLADAPIEPKTQWVDRTAYLDNPHIKESHTPVFEDVPDFLPEEQNSEKGNVVCGCGNAMMRSFYPEHLPKDQRDWYCSKCKSKKPFNWK